MSVETLGINKRKYSTHTFFFIIQPQDWIFLLLLIFMQVICPVYTQNCKDSVYCNQKLGGDINVFFKKKITPADVSLRKYSICCDDDHSNEFSEQ